MAEHWGKIVELWRYPVSALRGERVDQIPLDAHGVLHDRSWGMIDADGKVAAPESERRWRFAPDILSRMGPASVEISTDGSSWLPVPSDAATAEASRRAGFPVTFTPLAHTMAAMTQTSVAPRYDRGHLHLLTTASLRSLADILPPESRVDSRRFRPNIVVDMDAAGQGFPDRQLIGRQLRIGGATISVDAPCERCSFTALAQGDLPFAKDVLHAIARHGGGGFGVLCSVIEAAPIQEGDAISLT